MLALLLLLQDDAWLPVVSRKPHEAGEALTVSGSEGLIDGAILSLSVRRQNDLRRAEDDAPEAVVKRMMQFDRIPVTRTERLRVKDGRWEHSMIYPKDALMPGLYALALDFDPTAQPLAVRERLPKDVTPFSRTAATLLTSGDDTRFLAEDVRRVATAIRKLTKEFQGIADAAEHGRVTRGMVTRVLRVAEAEIAVLEPHCETSAVFRTIWQIMSIPNEIDRGLSHNTSGKDAEEDPGRIAGAAVEALTEGARIFPVEFHLYMRTLLADVRDRMWAAYVAGRPAAWAAFRAEYIPAKRVLDRGHEEMTKHETEAEYYLKRDEAEETSIGKTLELLETLFKQCDEHLKDPEAPAPDELAQKLEKLLPAPRP